MTTTRVDFVKSYVEQAMLERILYIGGPGEDLPELRSDVPKHVFMGTPAELIAAIEAPINTRIEAIKEAYEDQLRLANEAVDEIAAERDDLRAKYTEACGVADRALNREAASFEEGLRLGRQNADRDVRAALTRAEAAILAESYSLTRERQADMRVAAAIVQKVRDDD